MLAWLVLWVLYLSIVNVGQTFYGFGWESLLLEAGFLAVFLGMRADRAPSWCCWLFRWLAFRVEFGAGLIKLRGDPLLARSHLPRLPPRDPADAEPAQLVLPPLPAPFHRLEVLGNHVAQLVVPFGLFAAAAGRDASAALIMVVTQLWLVISGNLPG